MLALVALGGFLALGILAAAAGGGALFPAFHRVRPSTLAACSSNIRQLQAAMLMYVQDNDERFPPSRVWGTAVRPYARQDRLFECPQRPYLPSGFADSYLFDGLRLKDVQNPARAPVLFECLLGNWDAADNLAAFALPHEGTGLVAYADGHVQAHSKAPPPDAGLGR